MGEGTPGSPGGDADARHAALGYGTMAEMPNGRQVSGRCIVCNHPNRDGIERDYTLTGMAHAVAYKFRLPYKTVLLHVVEHTSLTPPAGGGLRRRISQPVANRLQALLLAQVQERYGAHGLPWTHLSAETGIAASTLRGIAFCAQRVGVGIVDRLALFLEKDLVELWTELRDVELRTRPEVEACGASSLAETYY